MASICRQAVLIGTAFLVAQALTFAQGSEDGPGEIDLRTDDVVVTATRFPEEQDIKRPANITVISREDIEASPARTVPEILAGQVGVAPSDLFGNNGTNTKIDLRGFGATGGQNTLILVNGRRVSDPDLSGVKWSAIPLSTVERIEVVRGTGSVLYGDGAVAGVVNIITRSPSGENSRGDAGVRYGSFDTREARVDATLLKDEYGLNINAYTYSSDGYRDNNETDDLVLKLDLQRAGVSNDVSLRVGADRQDVRLPGPRTVQPSAGINELEDDRRGTSTPLDYATRDEDYATLALASRQGFGLIDAELSYRQKEQTSFFDGGIFPDDYREVDLGVWSLTPRMKIPADAFGRKNQLVVGLDFYSWDYQLDRSNDPANIGTPINKIRAKQRDFAYYLHDILTLTDTLQLSLGWREQWQRIEATDDFDPTAPGSGIFDSGAPDGEQDLREDAYELGARYELAPEWSLLASTGRSFRFATIDEIYNFSPLGTREFQFLRPQTSQNLDFSLERRWRAQLFRATVFQIDLEDEIRLNPYKFDNTNLPPSRRRGLELESALSFPGVNLGATYAYTEAKFIEGTFDSFGGTVDISGNTVPLVPRHKATAYANWMTTPNSSFTVTFRYVSEQFMDNDEANDFGTKIPPYAVVDLKYSHEIANWRLGVIVNNAFDEKFFAYSARSVFVPDRYNAYPLPERAVTAFAEYRFGQ
ncbi:MAG: TonB-dependent receptor [Betaproteobacteria bacterium]|jgi:iron complex outermembrane receptor protein|nr:MAG: TonB-dependent receptor [Betaproteobacteria bacterium]